MFLHGEVQSFVSLHPSLPPSQPLQTANSFSSQKQQNKPTYQLSLTTAHDLDRDFQP